MPIPADKRRKMRGKPVKGAQKIFLRVVIGPNSTQKKGPKLQSESRAVYKVKLTWWG